MVWSACEDLFSKHAEWTFPYEDPCRRIKCFVLKRLSHEILESFSSKSWLFKCLFCLIHEVSNERYKAFYGVWQWCTLPCLRHSLICLMRFAYCAKMSAFLMEESISNETHVAYHLNKEGSQRLHFFPPRKSWRNKVTHARCVSIKSLTQDA